MLPRTLKNRPIRPHWRLPTYLPMNDNNNNNICLKRVVPGNAPEETSHRSIFRESFILFFWHNFNPGPKFSLSPSFTICRLQCPSMTGREQSITFYDSLSPFTTEILILQQDRRCQCSKTTLPLPLLVWKLKTRSDKMQSVADSAIELGKLKHFCLRCHALVEN